MGSQAAVCLREISNISRALIIGLLFYSSSAMAVFQTDGQFSVGPNGDANYSISLDLPPGTAGMQPVLALTYNSQRSNGYYGAGWDLEGISEISRCPQTRADDGVKAGFKYEVTDKFCLDGQRLVAINGTYGADGTEYRTQVPNFSKIISYGVAGNGPSWFKVWTKNGLVYEYGNTADSKIEAAGKPSVRVWSVNKVSDTKLNFYTFTYTEDNANGEYYLNKIDYTGNSNSTTPLAPYASIQFTYDTRTDVSTNYINSSVIKVSRRVSSIKTFVGSTRIKNYKMTYQNNGAYLTNASGSGIGSLLSQIQECDGSTPEVCKSPTVFTWQVATPATSVFATPSGYSATNVIATGDANSDGMEDSVYYRDGADCTIYSGIGNFYVTNSNGSGFSGAGNLVASVYGTGGGRRMNAGTGAVQCDMLWPVMKLADIDLDGKSDLITHTNTSVGGTIQVKLSSGTSFSNSFQNWGGGYLVDVGDFNGDGKADFLYDTSTPTVPGTLFIGFSSGTQISSSVNTGLSGGSFVCVVPSGSTCGGYFYIPPELAVGDFNGDGLADLVLSPGGDMYFSTGSGLGAKKSWILGVHIISVGDVNGDGIDDILYDTSTPTTFGSLVVALSDGNQFLSIFDTALTGSGGAAGGGWVCAGYVNGLVWNGCPAPYKNIYKKPSARLSDINGDGFADLQYSSGKVYFAKTVDPDLVTGISYGLGQNVTISYSGLSSSTVYSPDSGGIYPIRDIPLASSIKVVNSYTISDGIGGVLISTYSYGGAKADLSGRGFLGFRWVKASSVDSGISETTFYRQDYPYIGMPSQIEKKSTASVLLQATQNTFTVKNILQNGVAFSYPYLSQSLTQEFELDGGLVSSITTVNEYDDYGNVTKTSTNTNDGYSTVLTNTYMNDTVNWFLGRLLRSSVTKSIQ